MRSRKAANEHVTQVARRRLELLSAELAQVSRTLPAGQAEDRPPDGPARLAPVSPELPLASSDRLRVGRHAQRSLGLWDRVLGWVHDRLPPTLQGRVQLGSSHLTVLALLVAAALAVTAWWVIRADGGGTLVPAVAVPSGDQSPSLPLAAADGSAAPVASGEASGSVGPAAGEPAGSAQSSASASPVVVDVVVDVAGKVRRPGIATLPAGSRVVDALEAAGGARRGVNLTALNMARVLVDGEQILVGVPPPAGVAAPAASAPGEAASGAPASLVNLNSADQAELETLPGVGPVTAGAILAWRTDNGAFASVDELLEVSGIGDATLAEIAPFVTI